MRLKQKKFNKIFIFIVSIVLLTACSENTLIQLPESLNTPLLPTNTRIPSPTPTVTLRPTRAISATPLPSPTSTPRSHLVKLGETLGGIAWSYGVSLEKILELNPDVNPNAMKVGITILIPAETKTPANQTPQPTPMNLMVKELNCLPDAIEGIWCFGWVENNTQDVLESAIVNVNVADQVATNVYAESAVLPLNMILPAETLPFAVYFDPPMPNPFQSSAQFLSAIPLNVAQNQYSRLTLKDETVKIIEGSQAKIHGTYQLANGFSEIWIVAVAENANHEIIGLRRWQSSPSDDGVFEMSVFAVQGQISSIFLFAEAQP